MEIKGMTDVGLRRETNQDDFYAEKIGEIYLAVVNP